MNYIKYSAVAGAGLLAYCLYFDHQRRAAPDYCEKVRLRRKQQRDARENEHIELPPKGDSKAIESFFIKEIELGEELMQMGEVDRAVKHLSYAVAFCPQTDSLLSYMREVLPPSAYEKLLQSLVSVGRRIREEYIEQ